MLLFPFVAFLLCCSTVVIAMFHISTFWVSRNFTSFCMTWPITVQSDQCEIRDEIGTTISMKVTALDHTVKSML